tara:strand:+ start:190 stop:2832 length:2643 start_codon:yes stop_codon:yes gene_type:complete
MRKYLILFLFFSIIKSIAQDYEYKLFYESKELKNSTVYSITQDPNGYLWLGTSYGLCRFDGQNFKAYYKEDGLLDNFINKVVIDHTGLLWLLTREGFQTFDGDTFSDEIDVKDRSLPLVVLKQINAHKIELDRIPTKYEISDTITYEGNLFVATKGNGIWLQTNESWKDLGQSYYFGRLVNDLYLDSQNNFWIASNYGLAMLIKSDFKKHPIIQKRGTLEMIEYDGALWIAGQTGINRIKDGIDTWFPLNEKSRYMICLGISHTGKLQAGGIGGNLYEWNGEDFEVQHALDESLKGLDIFDITHLGLSTYYACKNKILKWDSTGVKELRLGGDFGECYDIQVLGNRLYFACSEGLFMMVDSTITQYTVSDGMSDDYCRVLEVDGFGNLWIGTYSEGLMKFDGQNFESFTIHNGLSNNLIKSLEWDANRNCLWVGTNEGLNQLKMDSNAKNITCKVFNQASGYSFLYCHDKSLLVLEDGSLLFSVNTNDETFEESIFSCEVEDFDLSSPPPNVLLTSFKILNKENPSNSIIQSASLWNQNIKFTYNQNDLSFLISGIHLSQGDFISYQWYLEGYENSWRQETTQNRAHYTNLSPGDYSLNIRSKVSGSDWSSTKQYTFSVVPPFWKKWWFTSSITLLLLALVYTLISIYQKRMHQNQLADINQLKQKAELELKALRSQLNPHFIFNVLNSIQYSLYDKTSNIGLNFIQDFAILMRKTLLHSRKNLIPFKDEVDFLKLYIKLENARFETPFSFHLDLKEDEDYFNIYVPPLLLQPYVENAIKHGLFNKADHSSNRLVLKFRLQEDLLICTLTDNGVGREIANAKKGKHHESQGLQMMQERLDYLNIVYKGTSFVHEFSDVLNEKGIIFGTQVILKIPLYLRR